MISTTPSTTQPRSLRLVADLYLGRAPMDAPDLLSQVVTERTRYLVLDLDRTIHRGWNIGELLGWDVIAYHYYGDALLEPGALQASRFHLDPRDPITMARYLRSGVQRWANPGLRYFLGVKASSRAAWARRLMYLRYGPEPVGVLQTLPRVVAMHHLAELPLATLHALAHGIWDRCAPDQVLLREDFDALRARFPQLKIILSSASPQPVLDVAKARLGVDDVLFTEVPLSHDRDGDFLYAPHRVDLRHGMSERPRRIAGPRQTVHNAGLAKMPQLVARYPDFADPTVEKVGITDTGYGEDHDWAGHFTRVVDVNSAHPFSPFIKPQSPLREIWSVQLRSRAEREAEREAELGAASGRGREAVEPLQLTTAMQRSRLQSSFAKLASLHASCEAARASCEAEVAAREGELRAVRATCDATAETYNHSAGRPQIQALRRLTRLCGEERQAMANLARAQRPMSEVVWRLRETEAAARRALAAEWAVEASGFEPLNRAAPAR